MSQSLAEQLAALSEAERAEALEGVDLDEMLWDWRVWGRPEQFAPSGDWGVWLAVAGRGWGKTRCGSEWIREVVNRSPGCSIMLVARTAADVRDVMVQGPSGIMNVFPPSEAPVYSPANRLVTFQNGSKALCFSSEQPDQLRGPQSHYTWADETAAWKFTPDSSGLTAWDNARIATRLPDFGTPRILATTTPKRTPFMKKMLAESNEHPLDVVITRGTTYDNAANMDAGYLRVLTGVYEGSSLARQELLGLMLDDVEGALFTETMLEASRVSLVNAALPHRVVAVDPSVAEQPTDECGIVVVGATGERDMWRRHAFVLEDATVWGSPETWVKQAVRMAKKWRCPIVAEKNQGHALIDLAIKNVDASIPVLPVIAKVGKALRAEPVVMAYEQGRVHHVGNFADLEAQMMGWIPEETRKSPDRLDALVHGVTALLVAPPKGMGNGKVRAKSQAGRQIPGGRGTGLVGGQGRGGRAA